MSKTYYACQKCGMMYPEEVAEKFEMECHSCGNRLKEKES